MTLVQMSNVKKSFGACEVLCGIDARIFAHSKIGLVGANGSGKTTLIRIILGELAEDEGEVIRQRDLKIAYLPQIPKLNESRSVLDEALFANEELYSLAQQLHRIEEELASAPENEMEALIEEQAHLSEIYERWGGYRHRADTEAILEKLGFSKDDLSLPVRALSGGQKNRMGLVCTLLTGNDLLLLDEPTNFLDVTSTEWLEGHLKTLSCAMVIISHDRYFLNEVVTEIWDIENGRLEYYKGNYDAYRIAREQKQQRQEEIYQRQQEEVRRQEEFIRRNIVGQKHRQAQSRRKVLERMERVEAVKTKPEAPRFAIRSQNAGGGRILETRDLGHAFDSNLLFEDLSFALDREEKMAVVGPNGCGKSTLLHILIGRLEPSYGSVALNPSVSLGFYHQELKDLSEDDTGFDTIKKLSPATDDRPIRDFLAGFLFCGDEIFKRVRDMSGGEKSRLAMARLLFAKPYFLVLDEPTNHLDIPSRQALEQALKAYTGTLLFVSHDRYFIDEVATCILYFHQKSWILFYGNYSEFYASKEYLLPRQSEEPGKTRRTAHEDAARNRPSDRKRRKKYKLEDLEAKIIASEARLAEITQEMSNVSIYQNPDAIKQLKREYDLVSLQLKEWNEEWENWE